VSQTDPAPASAGGPEMRLLALGALGAALCLGLGLLGGQGALGVAAAGVVAIGTLLARLSAGSPAPDVAAAAAVSDPADRDGALAPIRALLTAAPDSCVLVDAQGRIAAANPLARERLAISKDNLRFDAQVRRPELIEAVGAAIAQRRSGDFSFTTMVPVERHERAIVSPVEIAGRSFAFLVIHDETDLKRAERTRADFIANASHELRTPLASLSGFIETLRGPARDDEAARDRFLDIMSGQAERMGRLINDLLSLSRVELNEHVPPTGRADLAAVAREVADALGPVARVRGVRLRVEVPGDAVWVTGDWDELIQVAQNLIDNAIKHTAEDSAVVIAVEAGIDREALARDTARVWPEGARMSMLTPAADFSRRFAMLRVRDEGDGIDRRHLPRLAERFYRVDEARSSAKGGTGLGLAIVKHIINRHGGGFAVESAVGSGAAFSAFFPQPSDIFVGRARGEVAA
jgi:two-component system phosphate regulon sensor histidine kinase PhoR